MYWSLGNLSIDKRKVSTTFSDDRTIQEKFYFMYLNDDNFHQKM